MISRGAGFRRWVSGRAVGRLRRSRPWRRGAGAPGSIIIPYLPLAFSCLFSRLSASVVTHGLISHDPSRKRDHSPPQFPVSRHRPAFGRMETGQSGGQDGEGPDVGIRRVRAGARSEIGGEGEQNLNFVRLDIHAGGVVPPRLRAKKVRFRTRNAVMASKARHLRRSSARSSLRYPSMYRPSARAGSARSASAVGAMAARRTRFPGRVCPRW